MNCLPGEFLANWICNVCELKNLIAAVGTYHHIHANFSIHAIHEDVAIK